MSQLLDATQDRREQRSRLATKERERVRVKVEREAAAARQQRLDALAREGDRAWTRVIAHVDAKKTTEYDAATALLSDLRDVSGRDGQQDLFTAQLCDLRQRYANRPALLGRLDRAGLRPLTCQLPTSPVSGCEGADRRLCQNSVEIYLGGGECGGYALPGGLVEIVPLQVKPLQVGQVEKFVGQVGQAVPGQVEATQSSPSADAGEHVGRERTAVRAPTTDRDVLDRGKRHGE